MIQNRLLQTFLTDEKIRKLYTRYLEHPSNYKKEIIERLFQIHVRKIQLLSYFSKTLYFESQKYDKKIRHINSVSQLDFEKNLIEGESLVLDLIGRIPVNSHNLEFIFEDKHLYEIVSSLSPVQKSVLHLLFVEELTETEAANRLGVTKQAINKTKNKTLKKIKKNYQQGVL